MGKRSGHDNNNDDDDNRCVVLSMWPFQCVVAISLPLGLSLSPFLCSNNINLSFFPNWAPHHDCVYLCTRKEDDFQLKSRLVEERAHTSTEIVLKSTFFFVLSIERGDSGL
jgi:hypothetical protein